MNRGNGISVDPYNLLQYVPSLLPLPLTSSKSGLHPPFAICPTDLPLKPHSWSDAFCVAIHSLVHLAQHFSSFLTHTLTLINY